MGKRQVWSVAACVFLFLSLASQIHCKGKKVTTLRIKTPKEKDLIDQLPGQPSSINFKQYGGYVSVNETAGRFLYYYFAEAINANDSTPLVIWLNGGPACSSIGGVFSGIGPFRVRDGKTLSQNPYAWNNEANVLFIEGPVGVGFSYSKTPIDIWSEGGGGDKSTAEQNYMFLVNWLERFPEFKKREIFIAGVSYAGHYVPQLAQLILHRNKQTFINLRGIIMGNPALEYDTGELEYMASHALVTQDFVVDYHKACSVTSNPECRAIHKKFTETEDLVMKYNIYEPLCQNTTSSSETKEDTTIKKENQCGPDHVSAYLNTKKVQEAMHANTTNTPGAWESCNRLFLNCWNVDDQEASMLPILQELMDEGVRVWVFSGDVDLIIPVTGTIATLKRMNLTVEKEWRPWFIGGQLGGFTMDYKGNLKFISALGAGHSVAHDKPVGALTIFTSFLRNTSLPHTR